MRKLTKKEKEQRLYNYYKQQHNKFKKKYGYNLTRKLSKKDFLEAYKDYKEAGSYQVVSDIVRDQRDITEKQAAIWAKNLRRNVKEWRKKSPNELTDLQNELIKLVPDKMDRNFFWKQNKKARDILALINSEDAWEEAVGS